MADGALAVDLAGVSKRYKGARGGVLALDDISLQVARGAVFGLLGPNGAGKSTLVKIMMTIVRPTAARGTVLGFEVGDKRALERVGYLPEHHRFPRHLTGRQTLDFFASLSGVERATRRRRAEELLELVGMRDAADRKMGTYSKGMMQRVGLAQALVNNPELVVLDEPTDGVDVQGRRDVRDVLLRLKGEGKTIFLNSHLLSELEQLCDRVAILVKGKVVKQGVIGELTLDRQRFEIEIAGDAAGAALGIGERGVVAGGVSVTVSKGVIKAATTDAAAIQPMIDQLRAGGHVIRRVQWVKPSLEELFIETVEGKRG
jgi:ABC-2 type transport system ATP-binding protein